MKMKKVISITMVLLISFMLLPASAFAATTPGQSTYGDYANSLAPLGVFVGTGSGYELDRAPTRVEGLVMLIRLLGVEDEALLMRGTKVPFNDVPKWANGYVAYAYANDLTKGVSKTKFGSSNNMEAKAFVTFLLRSLGYRDAAGDFSYTNALSFAKGISLINNSTYSTLSGSPFLRAHVAKTSYDTLKFPIRGTDVPLINNLMAEGKINNNVGNAFIATVLQDPVPLTSAPQQNEVGNIEIADNANCIVMINATSNNGESQGSGVILSSDGTIVTNYHVIEGARSLVVTFNDGSTYQGAVYVQDYNVGTDLAILKINKSGLRAAVIGDSRDLKQGESIVVIGSPYGLFNSVTEGIVSAIRPQDIQVSAAINHGNSGGGLFNSRGELVGITYARVEAADNLGFAIPINKVEALTGKKMMALSSFSNITGTDTLKKIAPPNYIYIVDEKNEEVHINWNPVNGADYYYFYYQEDGEDTYWYDEEQGKQKKFYYSKDYSVNFYNLTPGVRYNIIVTSVSGGIESDDSEVFSFVKKYGGFTSYYKDDYGVPDFGRMFGIKVYLESEGSYFYKSSDMVSGYITQYADALNRNGFMYMTSYKDSDGNTVMIYENYYLDKTVTTSTLKIGGTYGYIICVYNKLF
ncbi:MAG: trypsin-like peptidase domain-containing protein [Anaerovoracaceae bacterium]|jgi:S1-C subfamily serine protease|nr:trypsin-like peptidase domain-containing protein [Anaerovoracaceae bacterium]